MTKVEFDKWVQTMWDKRYNDTKVNDLYVDGRGIILVYNRRNQKVGVARCHPKDKFDRHIGIAIAYARCKGIEVPKITVEKKLSEMKYGEKFIGPYGQKYYFIAKHPVKSGQCIVLRIVDNHALNFHDNFYEMVE